MAATAHDLVVRGGLVADGRGGEPVPADVAVDGGMIAAVGAVSGPGRARRSTPTGLLVTPGFVDIHTHYDGQATWDARLTPVLLARRHHRRHGQLRRRLRAGAARRARPPHLAHGGRRGHPRRRARRGDRLVLGELRRVPRRGRAAARTTSTCARSCPTARCASTSWASGPPASRRRRRRTLP